MAKGKKKEDLKGEEGPKSQEDPKATEDLTGKEDPKDKEEHKGKKDRKGKKSPKGKEDPKGKDADATSSFLSTFAQSREIRKPIEVQDHEKKDQARTADEYEIEYDPETDDKHPYERWRRNRVLRCLMSREIARHLDRKTFITVSVREAFIYIIFLTLLTIITLGSTPLDMFYFSQAMETLYTKQKFMSGNNEITFYDINTLTDVYFYLFSVTKSLYHDFWYTKPDPYENPDNAEEYFYENKLIGLPQLRQVRVKKETCEVHPDVKDVFENVDCYGDYSYENEDKEKFGTKDEEYSYYTEASKMNSMSITGTLATYGGGGYRVVLENGPATEASQTIFKLRSERWIQKATRAIFLEFVVYNGNVNLFCVFKVILERPPNGGIIPSHWNYIQKLIRYNDSYDFFVLGCEIVFIIFFLFFTIQKFLEIITLRSKILTSFWNWIDVIILVMCYCVIILDILLYVVVNIQMPELVSAKYARKYASFDQMCYLHTVYSYCFAVLITFAFLRLLKYLNVVYAMYQLQSTISRSAPLILTYCIMFFYVYFVFALVGMYLFGHELEDYKTFAMAVFALMRSSVGDFNYNKLVQSDPFLGPLYFFLFIFLVTFILSNIFLAILVSKYEEVRSEVRIGGAKTFVGDMIKLWCVRCLERCECNWLLSQIARKQYEKKARSPTEAIRMYLRQAGYSELEIELFFKKYDITDAKISAMDEDRLNYKSGEREAPPPLSQKDIMRYIIIQKLEYLESHYEAANRLIDEFLHKLQKFDKKK